MLGPIVQDRSQSLQIVYRRHVDACRHGLYLCRNVISLSCQPRVPVSTLNPTFLAVEHIIRQPSFHSPPDQPAFTTFAQILVYRDSDAKLDEAPIKGRRPNIDPVSGSQPGKPVGRLTVTVKVKDSTEPAIAMQRRVETQIFSGCSINHPASSGKLWMN